VTLNEQKRKYIFFQQITWGWNFSHIQESQQSRGYVSDNVQYIVQTYERCKLRTFERRILIRIHGPTCENGVWRIKYNDEVYGLYKDLDTE
jgi:hypothetical protein